MGRLWDVRKRPPRWLKRPTRGRSHCRIRHRWPWSGTTADGPANTRRCAYEQDDQGHAAGARAPPEDRRRAPSDPAAGAAMAPRAPHRGACPPGATEMNRVELLCHVVSAVSLREVGAATSKAAFLASIISPPSQPGRAPARV